jgi:hypothetical protein
MHSAIVVIKQPLDRKRWQDFLNAIEIDGLLNNLALARLGQNIWQAHFQKSPAAFAQLIVACERHQLAYEILPLADAPQWLRGGSDRDANHSQDEQSYEGPDDD